MLSKTSKEFLLKEISVWQMDGLIPKQTLDILAKRYEARAFTFILLIKYLGIVGGVFGLFGILGLISALAQSPALALFICTGICFAFFFFGLFLSSDVQNRYTYSSKVLLTLGIISLLGCMGLLAVVLNLREREALILFGLLFPLAFYMSYRYQNGFLLLLTLLLLFQWVGTWNRMIGRSTYEFSVCDPIAMSVFSLIIMGIGIYHERCLLEKTLRLYLMYQTVALLYLNMSLLILSIWSGWSLYDYGEYIRYERIAWMLVFTIATVLQIAVGAYLKNGLFTGFGVTFFAINIFTRYHEYFWNKMHIGVFFLLGGGLLLIVGLIYEYRNKLFSRESQ